MKKLMESKSILQESFDFEAREEEIAQEIYKINNYEGIDEENQKREFSRKGPSRYRRSVGSVNKDEESEESSSHQSI